MGYLLTREAVMAGVSHRTFTKDVRAKRLVAQLANLGFDAKLTPFAQAA